MLSVLVWGWNWFLFMHGWFWPIRLINLIRWKSLHFEKKTRFDNGLNVRFWEIVFTYLIYPVMYFLLCSSVIVINHTIPFIPNWYYLMIPIPNMYHLQLTLCPIYKYRAKTGNRSVSLCTQTVLYCLTSHVLNTRVCFIDIQYNVLTSVVLHNII